MLPTTKELRERRWNCRPLPLANSTSTVSTAAGVPFSRASVSLAHSIMTVLRAGQILSDACNYLNVYRREHSILLHQLHDISLCSTIGIRMIDDVAVEASILHRITGRRVVIGQWYLTAHCDWLRDILSILSMATNQSARVGYQWPITTRRWCGSGM